MTRLIVAAVREELGEDLDFYNSMDDVAVCVTGPGKLQASIGLMRAIAQVDPDEVIVVGTCGALVPGDTHHVVEVGSVFEHDSKVTEISEVLGRGVHLPVLVDTENDGVRMASGDSFVDSEARATLLDIGAQYVDMESYAYALVSGMAQVPIRIIKYVTDECTSLEDWHKQLEPAALALQAHLAETDQ